MARITSRIALGALLLPILLALTVPAHAMGSRENPLAVADSLIKEKRLDDAVLVLTEFIKANPDRFDQAQKRLREIVKIRESFNKVGEQLLSALIDEPENYALHEKLINKLMDYGRPDDPEIQKFVGEAEKTALFNLNRGRLTTIIDSALALTASQRYVEAARKYTEGFALYRDPYTRSGYDPITVQATLALVDGISGQIARFEAAQTALTSSTAVLRAAFASGNPAGIDAALPAAEEALAALAALRAETLATGRALQRQFQLFKQADPTLRDDSFLPFAYTFILGRASAEAPEGVAGSMASEWAALFDAAAGAADGAMTRRFSEAQALFSAGRFPEADAGFRSVRDLADRSLRFQGMWSLFLPTDVTEPPGIFGRGLVSARGSEYLRLQHLRDSAAAYASLALLRADLSVQETRAGETSSGLDAALAGPEPPEGALAAGLTVFRGLRTRTVELRKGMEELGTAAGDRGTELKRLISAGFSPRGSEDVQAAFEDTLAQSEAADAAFEIRTVALAAKAEVDVQERRLSARSDAVAQARRLLEGVLPEGAQEGAIPLTYPTQSLRILAETDQILAALRRDTEGILARYAAEPAALSSAPAVTAQLERARALLSAASGLAGDSTSLAESGRDRQRQAQSNRLEADRRLAEARAALAREDFETARERLERARERYLASLSFEEDETLRSRSDANIQSLGEQIVKAENERVVRDTRRLLSDGRSLYNAGEFARAEEALLQARARWKVTHTDEPEPEVENWLSLVQIALNLKTGRDIPQTAPLYPEMSQLLSLARKNFEDGRAAMDRKDRVAALQSFAESRKRIAEVKLVFPLNQEARVLELRIDQLSDPDAFNRKFSDLVSAARSKAEEYERLKRLGQQNSDATKALETAYGDLLDLQSIDARYAGLAALIARVEIDLGMRLPPPNPKDLADARALTASAQRIWDARDLTQFSVALVRLNEALKLDPNNAQASSLKDRILIYEGGSAVVALPSAGEALFNQAVSFFQNGDYINARIRLTRLYAAYAQARKVQKVSDLDSRLVARGYP